MSSLGDSSSISSLSDDGEAAAVPQLTHAEVFDVVAADGNQEPDRYSFDCIQQIAPYIDQLPDERMLLDAHFRDISSRGCTFFSDLIPDYKYLVVALGKDDERHCFTARVAHVQQCHESGGYIVGCQFIGRVQL